MHFAKLLSLIKMILLMSFDIPECSTVLQYYFHDSGYVYATTAADLRLKSDDFCVCWTLGHQ